MGIGIGRALILSSGFYYTHAWNDLKGEFSCYISHVEPVQL